MAMKRMVLAASLLFPCVALAFAGSSSGAPIRDEALRLQALRTIFPTTQIATGLDAQIGAGYEMFLPDALAGEPVVRVTGAAINEAEQEASLDVVNLNTSNTRRVRMKLFWWPGEKHAGLLAILQYDFAGILPAFCCLSIGRLEHLVADGTGWKVGDEYMLPTEHHYSLQKIELTDLAGDGTIYLVVESDAGGAGVEASAMRVFALSRGSFDEILATPAQLVNVEPSAFTQVLDIKRTQQTRARQFCVLKTTTAENGKQYRAPLITHPCYERGEGIDADDAALQKAMLSHTLRSLK
jgi:hypothetical protein